MISTELLASDLQQAETFLKEGVNALEDGEPARAFSSLDSALNLFQQIGNSSKEVECLILLGDSAMAAAYYDKARNFFMRAREICLTERLKEQEAVSLKKLGIVDLYQGKLFEAQQNFEEAYELIRSTDLVEEKSNILNNLGLAAFQIAKYETKKFQPAYEYFQRALHSLENTNLDHCKAKTLNNLGALEDTLQFYSEANKYYEEALNIFMRLNLPKLEADTRNNIGIVSRKLGYYSHSQANLMKALDFYEKNGFIREKSNTLVNLGNIKSDLGEFELARSYYYQAIKIYRDMKLLKQEANVLFNLGSLYRYLGESRKAIQVYHNARNIYHEAGMYSNELEVLLEIGNAFTDLNQIDQSKLYYKEVMNKFKNIESADAVTMEALSRFGDISKTNSDFEDFVYSFQHIAVKLGFPSDRELLIFMNTKGNFDNAGGTKENTISSQFLPTFGRFYYLTGNYDKAEKSFQNGMDYGDQIGNSNLMIGNRIGLASTKKIKGEYEEAKRLYIEAINMLEDQRKAIQQGQRALFFRSSVGGFSRVYPYEEMAIINSLLNNPDEAFFYAEHTKARSMLEELAQQGQQNRKLPASLLEEEQEITSQIAALSDLIQEAHRTGNATNVKFYKNQQAKVFNRQKCLITKIRADYPEYLSLLYPNPVHAKELALKENEVLIEYEVTEKVLLIFIIKNDEPVKIIEVPLSREELAGLVQKYIEPFKDIPLAIPEFVASEMRKYDPILGHKIYNLLLEKVLEETKDNDQILIVPDEFLALLPFESLVLEVDKKEINWKSTKRGPYPTGVRFVGESYFFSFWQSATALTILRNLHRNISGEQTLVIADPIFNIHDERIRSLTEEQDEQSSSSAILTRRRISREVITHSSLDEEHDEDNYRWFDFDRLPSTRDFADEIKKKYPDKVKSLQGRDANESRLLEEDFKIYKQIFFATHGIIHDNSKTFNQTALVLSNPAITHEVDNDGFLTMGEIMNMKLNAELVAALACETGLGNIIGGEGIMNLGRAFQYAGAQSVLVSLWNVADSSTNLLALEMIENIWGGKNIGQSLFAARKKLLESDYRHPFYWSSFILIGHNGSWKAK